MQLHKTYLAGLEYLATITSLLQNIRREDRFAGLYEAADLQWWWREDQAPRPERQVFWCDGQTPVAALLLYDNGEDWNCDFFRLPSLKTPIFSELLDEVLEVLSRVPGRATITLREEDFVVRSALESERWASSGVATVQTWLATADPPKFALPAGFRFEARSESPDRPHPMTNRQRNPSNVAERLSECSLYRPELDYAVIHRTGDVAAYALFWMDDVTGVGLVEPIRTEDTYQRKGLASALLAEGIQRLRKGGAETIKVSYSEGNEPARRLYHRYGFRDLFRKLEYRR